VNFLVNEGRTQELDLVALKLRLIIEIATSTTQREQHCRISAQILPSAEIPAINEIMSNAIIPSDYEGLLRSQLDTNQTLGKLCDQQQRIIKQQERLLTEHGISESPVSEGGSADSIPAKLPPKTLALSG
jgi:hypothetical protein